MTTATAPAQPVSVVQLRRLRWAVRATLTLGVAASVAANILHARPNPISQVIAAWPPLALLLTVELISRVPTYRRSLGLVRVAATAAIAGIAGIAAWVSYHHMAAVAAHYGETGASPYLLPLSVDGLVIVASISLVELADRIRVDTPEHRRASQPAPAEPVSAQVARAAPAWRPPQPAATPPASSDLPPAPRPVRIAQQAAGPAPLAPMPVPDVHGEQPAAGAANRNGADHERGDDAQVLATIAPVLFNGSGGAAASRKDPPRARNGHHARADLAEHVGVRTVQDRGMSSSVAAPPAPADTGPVPAPSPRPEPLQAPPWPADPTGAAPTVRPARPPARPAPHDMPVPDTYNGQRVGDASEYTGTDPASDADGVADAVERVAGQVVDSHDASVPTGVFDTPPDDRSVPSQTAAAVAYWHRRDPDLHPAQIGERIGRSERTVRRYWPPVQDNSTGPTNGDKAEHPADRARNR